MFTLHDNLLAREPLLFVIEDFVSHLFIRFVHTVKIDIPFRFVFFVIIFKTAPPTTTTMIKIKSEEEEGGASELLQFPPPQ